MSARFTSDSVSNVVSRFPPQRMLIRGLIERQGAGVYVLSDQGRAVLEALTTRAATRG
jgi:hypothetical protein